MSLWITATLAAAAFQTLRFMLQKMLASSGLTAAGATFARFFFSAPIAVSLVVAYFFATQTPLPALPSSFWGFAVLGGTAQIIATILVVMLFAERNFAVGITLKKTEVLQTALVGVILLGEGVSTWAFGAILLGLLGVLLLSKTTGVSTWRGLISRATLLGLASGLFFGVSAVSYRGASLQIDIDEPLLRAGITLAAVTSLQLVGMALWLRWRAAGEITRVWDARRTVGLVGLASLAGSFCWFTAFTSQNAAYVNAVGQSELIFSALISVVVFGERISPREYAGMLVLSLSVLSFVFLA